MKEKIQALVDFIRYHDNRYYSGQPDEVSNEVYDAAFRQLQMLEEKYPQYKLADSPTFKKRKKELSDIDELTHGEPMLSIQTQVDTSQNAAEKFNTRIISSLGLPSVDYCCELKFDGLAVNLTYRFGVLATAATRGNYFVGQNITRAVLQIDDIPKNTPSLKDVEFIEIRGEVYMNTANFNNLNERQKNSGQPLFANERNAAAGTLHLKNDEEIKARKLSFLAYGVGARSKWPAVTQTETLAVLENFGFNVHPSYRRVKSVQELMNFYTTVEASRFDLGLPIDGVVYKVDRFDEQKKLGQTASEPKWAMAHKFKPQCEVTTLDKIIIQVGRTGKLTPVAIVQPTLIHGVIVTRCTLSNEREINKKKLEEGALVFIQRAGDVIPEITGSVTGSQSEAFDLYKRLGGQCPSCQGPIVKDQDGVEWRCLSGISCKAQRIRSITHFASKEAMNIDGLGEKMVTQLTEKCGVKTVIDLFKLTEEDLAQCERVGHVLAKTIRNNIHACVNVSLERFIYALGIPSVGAQTAKLLAKNIRFNKEQFILDITRLKFIKGVGGEVRSNLALFFGNESNVKTVTILLKMMNIHHSNTHEVYCATGTFKQISRREMAGIIRAAGHEYNDTLTSSTTHLIVGEGASSKVERAAKKGIKLMTFDDFHSNFL